MTREDQIEDAADAFSRAKIVAGDINYIKEECFRQGAEWADANRWVKVEDDLPERSGCIFLNQMDDCVHVFAIWLMSNGPYPDYVRYDTRTKTWLNGNNYDIPPPFAWQYITLPEPPKAEQ